MHLAEFILSERKKLGWGQKDLADRVGVSQATVARWEAGSEPHGAAMIALSKTFNIPFEKLFDAAVDLPARPIATSKNEVDPLLLATWQKLGVKQRRRLVQIALILTEDD